MTYNYNAYQIDSNYPMMQTSRYGLVVSIVFFILMILLAIHDYQTHCHISAMVNSFIGGLHFMNLVTYTLNLTLKYRLNTTSLKITDDVRDKAGLLVKRAFKNPIQAIIVTADGYDFPQFTLDIPNHYCVCYRVIDVGDGYKIKHMSIGMDEPFKTPSVSAVKDILRLFKFDSSLKDISLRVTDLHGGSKAIHVIEKIK